MLLNRQVVTSVLAYQKIYEGNLTPVNVKIESEQLINRIVSEISPIPTRILFQPLKLTPDSLKNNAKETIAWVKSLGQGGGTCTEHFETRADLFRTRIQFISYDTPLSTLDENDTSQKRPANIITTNSGGFYGTYLREKTKELVFAYEQALEGKLDSKKKVSVTYQPSDVDNLIKGILYQAAKGLGRTSAEKLISILEYRYSDDLQKDLEEVR